MKNLPSPLMAKPTVTTTTTCWRITINNAPPPKMTQEWTENSHRTPLTRMKLKEKKKTRLCEEEKCWTTTYNKDKYNGDFQKLLGVPAILLMRKAIPWKQWLLCFMMQTMSSSGLIYKENKWACALEKIWQCHFYIAIDIVINYKIVLCKDLAMPFFI